MASHWVVSVGSILGTVLFNIFINDPDAGLKCIQIKFAGDTKLGGTVNSLSRGKAIGEILTNQRAWQSPTTLSLTRANPAFCTGNRQPWLHLHTGEQELESSTVEKNLGVLVDVKLNMSSQCAQAAKRTNHTTKCIRHKQRC